MRLAGGQADRRIDRTKVLVNADNVIPPIKPEEAAG